MQKLCITLAILLTSCSQNSNKDREKEDSVTSADASKSDSDGGVKIAKTAETTKASSLTGTWSSSCFSYAESGLGHSSQKSTYSFAAPDLLTVESAEYNDDDCGLANASAAKKKSLTHHRFKATEVVAGIIGKIDIYPMDSSATPEQMGIFKFDGGNLYLGFNAFSGNPDCDRPIQDEASLISPKDETKSANLHLSDDSTPFHPATGAPDSPLNNCRSNVMGTTPFTLVK